MKKIVNDENIDEIMFSILEGEITGQEKEQLLAAIEAEPAYAELWKIWQQTVLQHDVAEPVFKAGHLKKGSAGFFPIWKKLSVAAVLVLSAGMGWLLLQSPDIQPVQVVESKADNSNIVTPAAPVAPVAPPELINTADSHLIIRDSILNKKQRYRYMAQQTVEAPVTKDTALFRQDKKSEPFKPEPAETIHIAVNEDSQKPVISATGNIQVSVESHAGEMKTAYHDRQEPARGFLGKLFGKAKIKIEDEESTLTGKKIIIENNKYQIIAGF